MKTIVLLLFSSFVTASVYANTLLIGANLEISGDLSDVGQSSLEAASMAIDELNANGGIVIDGQTYILELQVADNNNNPEQAVNIARDFAEAGVFAMIGPNASGNAIPTAEAAEELGLLMVSPWSTNVLTTQDKQWVYRACFTDAFSGMALAQFAHRNLDSFHAAILFDETGAHNRDAAHFFRDEFESLGGTIVAFERYAGDDDDIGPAIERIAATNADVLFLPNYYVVIPDQVLAAREAGFTGRLLGTDAWGFTEIFRLGEEILEGAYLFAHFAADSDNPVVEDYVQRHREINSVTPNDVAALTYDAIGILAAALNSAQTATPEAARDALRSLKDFQGVTGLIGFSNSGSPIKTGEVLIIESGQFRYVETFRPFFPSFAPQGMEYR